VMATRRIGLTWSRGDDFRQREALTDRTPLPQSRSVRRVPLGSLVSPKPGHGAIGTIGCLADTRGKSWDDLDAIVRPTAWQGNLKVQLPADHYARLHEYRSPDAGTPLLWQVNAEGPDGCAAIALGILQVLAEANPEMGFTTTCSHGVYVPDVMLNWLASLDNVWVLHVVCGVLDTDEYVRRFEQLQRVGDDDKENARRFEQLKRFRDAGVPTAALIVTGDEWQNSLLRKRAAQLLHEVPDRRRKGAIIERPYLSPESPRSDGRRLSRRMRPSTQATLPVEDESSPEAEPPLICRGDCRDCDVLCGYHALRDRLSFHRLPLF